MKETLSALGYRPWRGHKRGSAWRFWPIARNGMRLVLKRRIFWVFLVASLGSFLFHSAIIYLVAQVQAQLGLRLPPKLTEQFVFTGHGEAYRNFIFFQGTVVMMMLALAGSLIVGDDFRSGAVAFYLSKPVTRLDYFLGKLCAAAGLSALVTLLPAVALFIEYGAFSESFDYYRENLPILGAICVYGLLVSIVPSVILLGVASLLQRRVAILIAWGTLFVFVPAVVNILRNVSRVAGLPDPWGWALFDLWADLRWISNVLFGIREAVYSERWPYAAMALLIATSLSVLAFWRRVNASEVVK